MMQSQGFAGDWWLSADSENFLARLAEQLVGKRVTPSLPVGRTVELPESDDVEIGESAGSGDDREVPLALFIAYENAKGERSQRRITVRQLIGHPPELILAYCHERRAARNFRLDRIIEAMDPETGEIYDMTALMQMVAAGGHRPVDLTTRRIVNILVFIMRCDGHAHAAEWSVIEDLLANWTMRWGGDDADLEAALRLAQHVAPDANDFLIGMRSFASNAEASRFGGFIARAVGAVIDADGVMQPQEFRWMVETREFLHVMANRTGN